MAVTTNHGPGTSEGDYFSGLWFEYQRLARTEEQTIREAAFMVEALGLDPAARILDVACGEGRHCFELATRGHEVVGIDLGERLIAAAQARQETAGGSVSFHHFDMRDIPWVAEFDAAVCFWGSFGFFDDEGDRTALKAVSRALKPGGRFLVDVHVAETFLPRYAPIAVKRVGDMLLVRERSYDPTSSRCDSVVTFVYRGAVERWPHSKRLYTYRELAELHRSCELFPARSYGSLDGDLFAIGSKRLLMVSRKRGEDAIEP